jgi:hypothetical protein
LRFGGPLQWAIFVNPRRCVYELRERIESFGTSLFVNTPVGIFALIGAILQLVNFAIPFLDPSCHINTYFCQFTVRTPLGFAHMIAFGTVADWIGTQLGIEKFRHAELRIPCFDGV